MISRTSTSPGRWRQEAQPHDGLHFGSLGEQFDRAGQGGMDAGRAQALAAGREAEAVVCGVQRDAEYGVGCACGRDAAADTAYSGRGAGGVQCDESELRLLARILRGDQAGASAGYISTVSGQ